MHTVQSGESPANTAARPDAAHVTTTVPPAGGYTPLSGYAAEPLAEAAPPPALADRIAQLSRQATALERLLRQTRGVLYAVFNGGLLDAQTNAPGFIAIMERAEVRIVDMPATTPAGVLAKAWVAWEFVGPYASERNKPLADMIRRADLPGLAARRMDLDFDQRVMLGVIEALTALVEASDA